MLDANVNYDLRGYFLETLEELEKNDFTKADMIRSSIVSIFNKIVNFPVGAIFEYQDFLLESAHKYTDNLDKITQKFFNMITKSTLEGDLIKKFNRLVEISKELYGEISSAFECNYDLHKMILEKRTSLILSLKIKLDNSTQELNLLAECVEKIKEIYIEIETNMMKARFARAISSDYILQVFLALESIENRDSGRSHFYQLDSLISSFDKCDLTKKIKKFEIKMDSELEKKFDTVQERIKEANRVNSTLQARLLGLFGTFSVLVNQVAQPVSQPQPMAQVPVVNAPGI